MKCNCVEEMNALLESYNTRIAMAIVFSNELRALGPIILTEKIDPAKKGAPRKVIASSCPFCGIKLTGD